LELRRYLSLLRKWGWLIVLIVVLAAGGSYFYSQTIPPTYLSESVLLVGQEQQSADPTPSDIYAAANLAQAYSLLVSQPSVLEAAAQELNWDGSWQSLYFYVSASASQGGQTFRISATAGRPELAQAIAAAITRQVILQSPVSQQQQAADAQRTFITDQQTLLQSQIVVAQQTLAGLNSQAALETDQLKLADLETRITALQTKIENWQRTYLQMGTLLNQSSGKFLTVLSPAGLPTTPISPNIPQYVAIAAIAGLVLAVGLVLLLEYLDDTIKTLDDVQRVLGEPTLGNISRINPIRSPEDSLITFKHPRSPTAEDYRTLRTNLRYTGIENPGGALLVTSANPGEGKTTTAANLAIAMAQAGKRVVLVDGDLRRPGVHRLFGMPNEIGLATLFLDGAPPLKSTLQESKIPGLFVLTAGEQLLNPAEVLDSIRMTELLVELRSESDMVVVDSPPLLVVADANILASRCSGALLVIDSGRTRSDAARRVTQALEHSKVKLLGIVLNRVVGRHAGYYNNYYYYSSPKPISRANGRIRGQSKGNGIEEPATEKKTG
jgi:non-specific protein-tyrosine kinase